MSERAILRWVALLGLLGFISCAALAFVGQGKAAVLVGVPGGVWLFAALWTVRVLE